MTSHNQNDKQQRISIGTYYSDSRCSLETVAIRSSSGSARSNRLYNQCVFDGTSCACRSDTGRHNIYWKRFAAQMSSDRSIRKRKPRTSAAQIRYAPITWRLHHLALLNNVEIIDDILLEILVRERHGPRNIGNP